VKTPSLLPLLGAVLLLPFTGCTKKESAPVPAPKPSQELNLFAWSEYVPQPVIDGFTRETGIRVHYETYASNEAMLSKLMSGAAAYDLVQPSEYMVEALLKAGKLAPLDPSRLGNLKNIDPEYANLPHDPGMKYSVPWMAGTVGIVVNTGKVAEPVTSYREFFQPKYKNRLVVLDDPREIVSWALGASGLDINRISPEILAQVRPLLAQWLPLVKVFDSDSPKTALLNGDVDLGIVWSGEAAALYQADKKFRYFLPAEGAHRFIDSLAIPAGAPHPDAAHLFINYILRPEVSKLISDDFPYTNPNAEARKLLSPAQLENPASYPPNPGPLETFHDLGHTAMEIDRFVTELRSN
jgi:spermidine/putrescine transport system permease protein